MPLDPVAHRHMQLGSCGRCGGLWFDRRELERVLRRGDTTGVARGLVDAAEKRPGVPSIHACAGCEQPLVRYELARAKVTLEVCGGCGGVWLERGMLDHLQTLRDGEAAREAVERPASREDWMFEMLLGLPVEFNVAPRRFPFVTVALVATNVLVFVAVLVAGGVEAALDPWALRSSDFPAPGFWLALLTSQFVHAGFIHLAGNMYFLYVLGDNVEDVFGRARFLAFYLCCGCIGGLAQSLAEHGSEVPMVGASGAIAGVAAAYAVIFRKARISLMIYLVQYKVSVLWYFGLWVAFNAFGAALDVFGVGWFAHLGGFAAGLAIAAVAYPRVLAAYPVLRYLNDGAYLSRRFRPGFRRRRRRRSARSVSSPRSK